MSDAMTDEYTGKGVAEEYICIKDIFKSSNQSDEIRYYFAGDVVVAFQRIKHPFRKSREREWIVRNERNGQTSLTDREFQQHFCPNDPQTIAKRRLEDG